MYGDQQQAARRMLDQGQGQQVAPEADQGTHIAAPMGVLGSVIGGLAGLAGGPAGVMAGVSTGGSIGGGLGGVVDSATDFGDDEKRKQAAKNLLLLGTGASSTIDDAGLGGM